MTLHLEFNGFGLTHGGYRAAFSASTEINWRDFGVDWSATMDGGGGRRLSLRLPAGWPFLKQLLAALDRLRRRRLIPA